MERVFVTSDLHFGHNRDFIWKDRGFGSTEEHDQALVHNWNETVNPEDTVYVLGDVIFKSDLDENIFEQGLELLKKLNGRLIIIRGNHDSEDRVKLYTKCENVISAGEAALYLKYPEIGGYTFYLSHYPTLVSHEKIKKMKNAVINLYGHTHGKEHFFKVADREHPYMYCCCMDAHECRPVLLDTVIEEILKKRSEWRDDTC